ncbi:MAG: discoidin domain-containing protein [Comamonadaceae bacterium]|nr:MAG: discoidin domain-containing protein [Comamonadaceae bacterium]
MVNHRRDLAHCRRQRPHAQNHRLHGHRAVEGGLHRLREVTMLLWQKLLAQQVAAAVAYRYWRIYVTAAGGNTNVQILEIELRATLGGADLTTGVTPVTTSSNIAAGYTGSKIVDNNLIGESIWMSGNNLSSNPQWARIDLGTAKSVAQLALHPAGYVDGDGNSVGSKDLAPSAFIVQGSNDDSVWTNVKSFSGITYPASVWRTFDL